jgi:adenylate cyclase
MAGCGRRSERYALYHLSLLGRSIFHKAGKKVMGNPSSKHYDGINKGSIKNEVNRIRDSKQFAHSKQLQVLLSYLVKETLAGRGSLIKAYTIATEVFGRDKTFNPDADAIVRVEARRLRQKLNDYYLALENKSEIRIDIPTGRYIPTFTALKPGLQLTDAEDGVKSESTVLLQTPFNSVRPSIAVLPFTNLGLGHEKEFLCAGISEQISTYLSKFQELEVINSYTVRSVVNLDLDQSSLAMHLRARFCVHGTLQESGEEYRITVQLSDLKNKTIIWAENFDIKFASSAFYNSIDEIVQRIVSQIGTASGWVIRTLLEELPEKEVEDTGALKALLRYYDWTTSAGIEKFIPALKSLEKAIVEAPTSALVTAALADMCNADYRSGFDLVPNAEDRAWHLSNLALRINPRCQIAHLARATQYFHRRQKQLLDHALRQTIEINPNNADMVGPAFSMLALSGDIEEGCATLEKMYKKLSFFPPWCNVAPFVKYYLNKNFDQSLYYAQRGDNQQYVMAPLLKVIAFDRLGLKENARLVFRTFLEIHKDRVEKIERLFRVRMFFDDLVDEFTNIISSYSKSFLEAEAK